MKHYVVPVTIIIHYSSLISELTIHISHSVTDFDRSICLLVSGYSSKGGVVVVKYNNVSNTYWKKEIGEQYFPS